MIAALTFLLLQSTALPKCDLSQGLITSHRVGPLRLGEAVRDVRRRCPTIRDTVVAVDVLDGMPPDSVRALVADVHGGSVIAFVYHGRVSAFRLTTAGPQTVDSLGVGASIRLFRRITGIGLIAGDHFAGVLLTISTRCGIRFYLSDWGPTPVLDDEETLWVRHELDQWPDSIQVVSMSVDGYGCRRGRPHAGERVHGPATDRGTKSAGGIGPFLH